MISGEECKLRSSPLCSFLHPPLISSLLGPNIPLHTLSSKNSNHFSLYSYCILINLALRLSRDSSVGIALGYGLNDWGSRVRFPAGAGIFLFTTASRTALGPTQPPIQWVPGALSLGVKRPVREADHSPPSSAEVKECLELYLHSPIGLNGIVLSFKEAQGQI
jgi:hypothetical protein